jgi:hypothetical protein
MRFTENIYRERHKWVCLLFVLYGITLLPSCLWAQLPKQPKEEAGSLTGEVVDAKGAPVVGALILWQAADGGKPHVLRSNAQGQFRIAQLRPGLYDLRASSGKTSSDWTHNVVVRPGTRAGVRLCLKVRTAENSK